MAKKKEHTVRRTSKCPVYESRIPVNGNNTLKKHQFFKSGLGCGGSGRATKRWTTA